MLGAPVSTTSISGSDARARRIWLTPRAVPLSPRPSIAVLRPTLISLDAVCAGECSHEPLGREAARLLERVRGDPPLKRGVAQDPKSGLPEFLERFWARARRS